MKTYIGIAFEIKYHNGGCYLFVNRFTNIEVWMESLRATMAGDFPDIDQLSYQQVMTRFANLVISRVSDSFLNGYRGSLFNGRHAINIHPNHVASVSAIPIETEEQYEKLLNKQEKLDLLGALVYPEIIDN